MSNPNTPYVHEDVLRQWEYTARQNIEARRMFVMDPQMVLNIVAELRNLRGRVKQPPRKRMPRKPPQQAAS